jgi:hypothetical protein
MLKLTELATAPETEVRDIDEKVKDGLGRKDLTLPDRDDGELTLDEQKKRAGMDGMSNRLYQILTNEILPLKARHLKSEAEYMYRVGEVYAEMLEHHAVYGRRDAELFAAALDCKRTTLDDYRHVASTWTHEQFSELIERRFETRPGTLSFSHLIEVASEKDEDERDGWIEQTLKKGWTVRALREKMRQKDDVGSDQNVEPANATAEPDNDLVELASEPNEDDTPLTVRRAITRTRGKMRDVVGAEAEWLERVIRPLRENPGHFGKPTRDELVSMREACNEVIGIAETYRTQIDELLNPDPEHILDDAEEGGEGNG